MLTPAAAARMKALAAKEASARLTNAGAQPANATGYELMLAKLHADKRRLKEVQSIERKAEVKRQVLPDYAPYVDGVLSADRGGADEVLTTVMVWRIDAGDHAGALSIAGYALRYRLPMPDQYQRTMGCLLAEEFADHALKAMTAGQPVDLPALVRVAELTDPEDMPDEVRAKLCKAIGYAMRDGNPVKALDYLRRAFDLHDKSGVKKDIEVLERKLRG